MAERLRNWILQDSYLNIFQNLLYICIYILHIQISFNNAFQKIYHTMRISFLILNTNEEKLLKFSKFIEGTYGTNESKCP